jgi:hypothetical protein
MDEAQEQAMWDAVTVLWLRKILDRRPDIFDEVYASLSPTEQTEVDAACDRHAARMRDEGATGW